MSEYFLGVTFPEQVKSPVDEAVVQRVMLPDCVIDGCSLGFSGTTLTMEAGYLLICGRVVRHSSPQSWSISKAKTGFARLVLTVDLTRVSTENSFDQVNDSIEYSTRVTDFESLDQTNINNNGTLYQFEVCVVSLGSNGITKIYRSAAFAAPGGAYAPNGYGLGSATGKLLRSKAELDDAIQSGWYHLAIDSDPIMIGYYPLTDATVFVSMFDENYGYQEISLHGQKFRLRRFKIDGKWGHWQFENPPMDANTEYETVEYWNSSPVYTKLLVFDPSSFTSQKTSLPHDISGIGECIHASAIWRRTDSTDGGWRQLPQVYYDGLAWSGQISDVTTDNIVFSLGYQLLASLRASTDSVYVTLKYTKQFSPL